ncbi:HNH endonuclease signature motif containing protein [Brevundimonas sp. SGAir0440]|uniref:HNH endonuclease signature motif containing protein n=1 Tax=Brevundimonas sp. SGAir0440 TaxID=2579977 RepID=UPI0010CD126A|nr:HNH endonuclease signature motif containing protein [Brevundimonas sp. SGAir0440]QCQ98535.1 HNH endonuclease [Brevundimonas sp. SGAir0440]
MTKELTQSLLQEYLSYDEKTGVFTWLKSNRKGKTAGNINNNGYIHIGLCGQAYQAHRLAWFYVHGVWPKDEIDHKDRNRANNAIKNLREATRTQNAWNSEAQVNNKSGIKGVHQCKRTKKWIAWLMHNKKNTRLGSFKTKEEAAAAYQGAATLVFGPFARFTKAA